MADLSSGEAKKLFKVSKTDLPAGECAISEYKANDAIVVIPAYIGTDKVVELREGAFKNSSDVSSIFIPDTVTKISEKTICNCRNLLNVFVPNSVVEMDSKGYGGAFYDNKVAHYFIETGTQIEDKLKEKHLNYTFVEDYPFMRTKY